MKLFRFYPVSKELAHASDLAINKRPKRWRHGYPERGYNRAFTDDQVREMRRAVANGEITIPALARKLGKNHHWIRAVIDGRSYAHVL